MTYSCNIVISKVLDKTLYNAYNNKKSQINETEE